MGGLAEDENQPVSLIFPEDAKFAGRDVEFGRDDNDGPLFSPVCSLSPSTDLNYNYVMLDYQYAKYSLHEAD